MSGGEVKISAVQKTSYRCFHCARVFGITDTRYNDAKGNCLCPECFQISERYFLGTINASGENCCPHCGKEM